MRPASNNIDQRSPMIFLVWEPILGAFLCQSAGRLIRCSKKYSQDWRFEAVRRMPFLRNWGLIEHYKVWFFRQICHRADLAGGATNSTAFQTCASSTANGAASHHYLWYTQARPRICGGRIASPWTWLLQKSSLSIWDICKQADKLLKDGLFHNRSSKIGRVKSAAGICFLCDPEDWRIRCKISTYRPYRASAFCQSFHFCS